MLKVAEMERERKKTARRREQKQFHSSRLHLLALTFQNLLAATFPPENGWITQRDES
jgi:hypothetical protein